MAQAVRQRCSVGECIKAVRQAIGDSGARPRIIQTLRGYGYRFIAAVEACAAMLADDATGLTLDQDHVNTPPPTSPRRPSSGSASR